MTIDAVTTKVDVAQLYLQAMRRANAEIVPSAPVLDEKANDIGEK